jgi:hypothetical protein
MKKVVPVKNVRFPAEVAVMGIVVRLVRVKRSVKLITENVGFQQMRDVGNAPNAV